MTPLVSIHYAELGLKGGNRNLFERRLMEDLHRALLPWGIKVRLIEARFVGELPPSVSLDSLREALSRVLGVAWFSFGYRVDKDEDAIGVAARTITSQFPDAKTFGLSAKRIDKSFPFPSEEICRRVGRRIQVETGLSVHLDKPDVPIRIDVLPRHVLVLGPRHEGSRGLPRGISGKLLSLFSGGIDSPVATWLMMARGATVPLLHFHPYRTNEEVLGTKITKLHSILQRYDPDLRLYLLPFDRYQAFAATGISPDIETVFFRRYMWRTAEAFAHQLHCSGLVTGDSLGQVASQTLPNLCAAQSGLSLPLFQPVIGLDKENIVKWARTIGTYEPSVEAYKDCCSLVSKKPKTRVIAEKIDSLEKDLNMERLVRSSLKDLSVYDGKTLHPYNLEIPDPQL